MGRGGGPRFAVRSRSSSSDNHQLDRGSVSTATQQGVVARLGDAEAGAAEAVLSCPLVLSCLASAWSVLAGGVDLLTGAQVA